jgi:hypothetical protein
MSREASAARGVRRVGDKKRQQWPLPVEVSESSNTGSGDEYVEHGDEASGTRPK